MSSDRSRNLLAPVGVTSRVSWSSRTERLPGCSGHEAEAMKKFAEQDEFSS